jgi:hypothetical protein
MDDSERPETPLRRRVRRDAFRMARLAFVSESASAYTGSPGTLALTELFCSVSRNAAAQSLGSRATATAFSFAWYSSADFVPPETRMTTAVAPFLTFSVVRVVCPCVSVE